MKTSSFTTTKQTKNIKNPESGKKEKITETKEKGKRVGWWAGRKMEIQQFD